MPDMLVLGLGLALRHFGVGLGLKYPGIDANYKATGTLRNDV